MAPSFVPIPLATIADHAELQSMISLQVPGDIAAAYTAPGQYVQLTYQEHKPGYFVIANAPGDDHFEFLIKESSPLTAQLRELPPGTEIHLSAPMGPGFPVDEAVGKDVLLVAAGSGIAALRPVIHRLLADRGEYRAIRLLYGERTRHRLAFNEEMAAWSEAGIAVHRCVSSGSDEGAGYHAGYVQDALRELAPPCAEAVGFLCGMEPMVVATREAFRELGGDPARLYLNY